MIRKTFLLIALKNFAESTSAVISALLLGCLATNVAFGASNDWRQEALDQTRRAATSALVSPEQNSLAPDRLALISPIAHAWQFEVRLYESGVVIAQASGAGESLRQAARAAGQNLVGYSEVKQAQGKLTASQLANARWFLTVRGPKVDGSIVSYGRKALEIVGDVTAVRALSRSLVRKAIAEQKEYLLR